MNESIKEITSKRIKELRLKHNLTMEKLSEMIGVSKSTIAKWENGYVDNMRQDNIMKLSKIFNVTPAYIMGYDVPEIELHGLTFSTNSKEQNAKETEERIRKFATLYNQLEESDKTVVDKLLLSLSNEK